MIAAENLHARIADLTGQLAPVADELRALNTVAQALPPCSARAAILDHLVEARHARVALQSRLEALNDRLKREGWIA